MRLHPILLVTVWGLLVQGCAGTGPRERPAPVSEGGAAVTPATRTAKPLPRPPVQQPAPVESAADTGGVQVYAYRAPSPPAFRPSLPVLGLVQQAQQQRGKGDLAGAAATLERALRIEPRNAHLWNRLAQVHLEQGSYGQAGSLAAKSNVLAGDDPALKRDNWRIIAAARRASGDVAGARAAEARATGGRP